jgi:acyl CoA:acetate/3-ketoacid CoA transferase
VPYDDVVFQCAGINHQAFFLTFRRGAEDLYPRIWQAIERDEIEAYNLPSGVLFQMHRAGAAGQPGGATTADTQTPSAPVDPNDPTQKAPTKKPTLRRRGETTSADSSDTPKN